VLHRGAGDLTIDYKSKTVTAGGTTLKEGDWISLNGTTGKVYVGQIPTEASPVVSAVVGGKKQAQKHPIYKMYKQISDWADQYRKIKVRTNADTPKDAEAARAFGAEGIGLCRTEHMFFEGDRIWAVREFILAQDLKAREKALVKLLPLQRGDFEGIFKAMDGCPVTIRLLDPPLHEFVPHGCGGPGRNGQAPGRAGREGRARQAAARDEPDAGPSRLPPLDHLSRAVRHADHGHHRSGLQRRQEKPIKVLPEIMVPLVGTKAELDFCERDHPRRPRTKSSRTKQVQGEVHGRHDDRDPARGPDGRRDRRDAEFFSFGTNDLTQMTFGFSRDDIGSFLPDYLDKKILPVDPFQSLDTTGVGQLVEMAVKKGRETRPDLKCGICGEHGGDPNSVKFC
jgi:pyruvate, orthophosphate dikinase